MSTDKRSSVLVAESSEGLRMWKLGKTRSRRDGVWGVVPTECQGVPEVTKGAGCRVPSTAQGEAMLNQYGLPSRSAAPCANQWLRLSLAIPETQEMCSIQALGRGGCIRCMQRCVHARHRMISTQVPIANQIACEPTARTRHVRKGGAQTLGARTAIAVERRVGFRVREKCSDGPTNRHQGPGWRPGVWLEDVEADLPVGVEHVGVEDLGEKGDLRRRERVIARTLDA